MNELIKILKAVSDPTRLRILMSLVNGELCVCRITALLKLAPSTISKHMSILKNAGLVESRKEGKWVFYKLNYKVKMNSNILQIIQESLEEDELIKADAQRLDGIINLTHEELCSNKLS